MAAITERRKNPVVQIGLIGDYSASVTAHRAIPVALKLAAEELQINITYTWCHTSEIGPRVESVLQAYSGIWCVPASPYANTDAALAAIRFARVAPRPFLGTCGGFQHALIEYSRNVLGITGAAHAELDPTARDPLIAPLSCALVERTETITIVQGSKLAAAYGSASELSEQYHCRYGLAPHHEKLLDSEPLRVVGRGIAGEPRAVELAGHPFFVATLFQPERAALEQRIPPLVRAFVDAAAKFAGHTTASD